MTMSVLVVLLVVALIIASIYQGRRGRGMRRAGEATNPHDSMQLRPHDH